MPRLSTKDRSELEGYLARSIAALPVGGGEIYGMDPGDREYSRSYGVDWTVEVERQDRSVRWALVVNEEPVASGRVALWKSVPRAVVNAYERHVVKESPPMSKYKKSQKNKERAEFALAGLEVSTHENGSEQTDVTDMLTNLMHLCEQRGWSFSQCLSSAEDHFATEYEGKE